ncbi:MAG: bifunctional tetrahydrofolate synthase/dihydrofolate synthase [Porticoccaceae bacterium]|jgi:dihydrofolate synthase/folylpolyglutamate synthase|nr:bifunctional tetrahydrofolate synthase/dihydrofolate synthase [Porticoccaceae bacterium]HLS97445.1 bifunctional tetrahydrofolate synthase/dihydrofolate synthase [Porticoccaceae bacterium]
MSTAPSDPAPPPAGGEPPGLDDWLARLEKNHPVEIDLGLERIAEVARRLALPKPARRVVTVAGTNGKGSCVRTLEQLLLADGLRVGAYSSPHLLRYNERIRIQGRDIDAAALCRVFARIDSTRGEVSLTYFEVGTLAALLLMAEADLDVAVLEVGLGGRFDAVNLVDPDIAVITAIDIDHRQWLGDTREQIALEKAGIARPGGTVVVADADPPGSLVARLGELGGRHLYLHRDYHYRLVEGLFTVELAGGEDGAPLALERLPPPALPLPSVAAALQVGLLLGLPLNRDRIADLCRVLALPGRFEERLFRGRRVVLDVAHNPAAAAYLRDRLARGGEGNLALVTAIMADKDAAGFIAALAPVAGHWYLGDLVDSPRALPAEQLAPLVYTGGQRGTTHGDIRAAFAAAIDATPEGGLVVVCGSFLTVAAITEFMGV